MAASRAEVDGVVEAYAEAGISHIVALRGDMPDMGGFEPHAEGYEGSVELVEAISARGGFDITVSAYPEKHPESRSLEDDIDLLKAKIDAARRVQSRNLCLIHRRICGSVMRRRSRHLDSHHPRHYADDEFRRCPPYGCGMWYGCSRLAVGGL